MKMKFLIFIIIGYGSVFLFTSCNKDDEIPSQQEELNFSMNCGKDSSYFYYTFNYDRIYLDISNHIVTIKFSDSVSNEYLDHLIKKNSEIDSISFINEDDKLAYGYLREDIHCEGIESLLVSLYSEDQILCANPNFYSKETIARGAPIDDKYDLMGLTDEFVVHLKDSIPNSILESLISLTNTKLIKQTKIYSLISADKYSDFNSLEMSRYFYETGYFVFSHPSFLNNARIF